MQNVSYKIASIIICLFFIFAQDVYGYYQITESIDENIVYGRSQTKRDEKKKQYITILDDIEKNDNENVSRIALMPIVKDVIAIDLIDPNKSLALALSNELNANKKILDKMKNNIRFKMEYDEEIYKRKINAAALEDLSVPSVDNQENYLTRTENQQRNNMVHRNMTNKESSQFDGPTRSENLQNVEQLPGELKGSFSTKTTNIDTTDRAIETENKVVVNNQFEVEKREARPEHGIDINEDVRLREENSKIPGNRFTKKNNVPFMIELLMAIQEYIISNPREIVIFMLIVALGISMMTSAIRK